MIFESICLDGILVAKARARKKYNAGTSGNAIAKKPYFPFLISKQKNTRQQQSKQVASLEKTCGQRKIEQKRTVVSSSRFVLCHRHKSNWFCRWDRYHVMAFTAK